MRKFIFCLLIILLSACSNKKAPQGEGKVTNAVGTQEAQYEENPYVLPEYKTEPYGYIDYSPLIPAYNLRVRASSELPDYPARNLVDRTWNSWAEGSPGNGVGESFTVFKYFLRHETVAGFALKNGHGNLDYYRKNNRVKSFKIYADGEYIETIPIKDSISFEQYIFEEPVTVYSELSFVIDDVYQGTEFNDTYIAEIALLKQEVNATQFYENILSWFLGGSDYQTELYEVNSNQIVSVPDADKLLLLDYLPFDIPYNHYWDYNAHNSFPRRSKIARLDGASSLNLTDNLPRLDGATAMYPLYSSFVRAVYPQIDLDWKEREEGYYTYVVYEWAYYPNKDTELYYRGSRSRPSELIKLGLVEFRSIVQCNTTSQAFQRLINGETDIIFCYEPSEAEVRAASARGKRFRLTPIAYDAFVFIVNNRNILNNISQQRIRDIYSGKVTNWRSISGVDEPIIAYQRRENSGSQTILQSIMRGDRLIRPVLDGEFVPGGMGGMIRKITSDFYNYNSAIGYTFLFYLTQMSGDSGVKALSVDGVAPTSQTIRNKRYPFVQTVYAITTGNRSENTRRFIEWILSAQGQELVAKTGYTPVR